VKLLNQKNTNFYKDFQNLISLRKEEDSNSIDRIVKKIVNDVKKRGDVALIDITKKLDNSSIKQSEILLSLKNRKKYKNLVDKNIVNSFKTAIKNITLFHKKQLPKNFKINKKNIITGFFWKPIESVGLYVPGGNAGYPSSLLMNLIPAKVAGVKRIVVVTPSKNNYFNPYTMYLLNLFGIKEVYQIGGAQAIAALAYGTKTIRRVDKIFGPGNAYVVAAKKQVYGKVGIDLIAGPSEIVVVADKYNNHEWIASDLIAQAEHDIRSQSILITDDENFAKKVRNSIIKLSNQLNKKSIVNKSIKNYGAIIIIKNLNNAGKIINAIAPEHLHLQCKNKEKIFKKVCNAGCIFLGKYTPEVFGDYIIGTNHILPTSGSSRFSSGLGVLDFMKKTSFASLNKKSFENLSNKAANMAAVENLDGHKLSVTIRQTDKK
tara:strand:- start:1188 stop:2483 length:1296 start_codon:yes stop_codon:yes gene_type:complete